MSCVNDCLPNNEKGNKAGVIPTKISANLNFSCVYLLYYFSVCAWFNSNNAAPAGSLDNTVENDFQNHHSQNKVTGLDSHKASEGALDG